MDSSQGDASVTEAFHRTTETTHGRIVRGSGPIPARSAYPPRSAAHCRH
jgi:hypothetical protein